MAGPCVMVRIGQNTDDNSVSFVTTSDFTFRPDGDSGWSIPQTVTIASKDTNRIDGRGLHSFTFQLILSAFSGIGGALRGC